MLVAKWWQTIQMRYIGFLVPFRFPCKRNIHVTLRYVRTSKWNVSTTISFLLQRTRLYKKLPNWISEWMSISLNSHSTWAFLRASVFFFLFAFLLFSVVSFFSLGFYATLVCFSFGWFCIPKHLQHSISCAILLYAFLYSHCNCFIHLYAFCVLILANVCEHIWIPVSSTCSVQRRVWSELVYFASCYHQSNNER